MKGASLGYLTKEGFRNVWVNRLMSLASITVLMACLVIIGLGAMLFFNINSLLDNIESQNVIMVYVQDGTGDADVQNMETTIKKMDNVESCVFVSKEDAFKAQLEDMGSDAELLKDMENPLPDAFKVSVKDMTHFNETVGELRAMSNIETVRENGDVADKLVNIRQGVTIVIAGMVALLFIVSLFIIANTIRITMFSRKLEISIMKAVGATNWFIRWPFMVEGILLGLFSAILGLGIQYGVYSIASIWLGNVLSMLGGEAVNFLDYVWVIFGIFAFIGIVIGAFGSIISLNKYLKEHSNVVEND